MGFSYGTSGYLEYVDILLVLYFSNQYLFCILLLINCRSFVKNKWNNMSEKNYNLHLCNGQSHYSEWTWMVNLVTFRSIYTWSLLISEHTSLAFTYAKVSQIVNVLVPLVFILILRKSSLSVFLLWTMLLVLHLGLISILLSLIIST